MNFAPGPWVVGPADDTVVTRLGADGVRYEIASIDGDYNDPDLWPVMEANARLIAAAPDLLAALQRCQKALAILLDPETRKAGGPDMLGWVYCCGAETQAREAIASVEAA